MQTIQTPASTAPKPPAEPSQLEDAHDGAHKDAHEDVDLSCESVAGEEDPGASLDMSDAPIRPQPASDQKVPE